MKKFIISILFTLLTFSFFAQDNSSAINKIVTSSVNNGTQIDIFFEESINPKTLSSSSVLINGENLNPNTKFTFNREGNQVRFIIDSKSNFTIQLINVRTNTGKTVTNETIKLSGDQTWKKY